MIKKIIRIKNVGKFEDFFAQGNVSLNKVNIFYGENSMGKTTLTSIIRSLLTNDSNLILERKTYGKNEDPYVEILYAEEQKKQIYKFQDKKWNENLKDVEIFDTFFVNENVYTGLEISSEHQKGLHQFALGEEGVTLAEEIKKIKENLQIEREKLNNLKELIKLIAGECFTIEEFIALDEDKNINKKIKDKEQEIKIAKAGKVIMEKQLLNEVPFLELSIDLKILKGLLQRSIKEISVEFLKKVEDHKKKLSQVLGKEAESWLQRGLDYTQTIQDEKCPFCQQGLKGAKSLIKAYEQYFNKEYKKYKQNISGYLELVNCFSIEEALNQKTNIVLQNDTLIEFWKRYLPSLKIFEVDLDILINNIRVKYSKITQLLKDKSNNILEPIDTEDVDAFITFMQEFNSDIETYNSQVRKWNTEINILKEKQLDLYELDKELKELKIKRKRFSSDISEICNKYSKISKNIEHDKKLVVEKRRQHDTEVSQKIEKYGEKINQHLEKFGVPFRITDTKSVYRGKSREPYLEYGIAINKYEIDLKQQVKCSMGEGDKNALAFAFFLAKVSLYKQIDDKIVIFDDPVSSLDRNRRRRTVEYIRELASRAKQIIVLTHNDSFTFELYKNIKKIGIRSKTLQIYNGKIEEWNIEETMKHPYFKRIAKLENFLDKKGAPSSEDIKVVRELIRLVLEDALKFRYFKWFEGIGDNCWLRTMIERLREVIKVDKNFRFKHSNKEEVLQELSNLCDFSSPPHHGDIDDPYKEIDSTEEVKNYVKSALTLIYEWL